MLEHIISNFKFFNLQNFHFVLNHQANLIKTYFNNSKENYKINFITEPKPLGTVGGIKLVKKLNQILFYQNCDKLFKIDYMNFIITMKLMIIF